MFYNEFLLISALRTGKKMDAFVTMNAVCFIKQFFSNIGAVWTPVVFEHAGILKFCFTKGTGQIYPG